MEGRCACGREIVGFAVFVGSAALSCLYIKIFHAVICLKKVGSMGSNTPSLRQRWNHLWQVWYGGYRSGKSFQGAPVRKIQRMPFKMVRGSLLTGLPCPLDPLGVSERRDASRSYCAFVMSFPFRGGSSLKSLEVFKFCSLLI